MYVFSWPTAAFPGPCINDVFCVPGTSVLPDSCHSESPLPGPVHLGTREILKSWKVRSMVSFSDFQVFRFSPRTPPGENLPLHRRRRHHRRGAGVGVEGDHLCSGVPRSRTFSGRPYPVPNRPPRTHGAAESSVRSRLGLDKAQRVPLLHFSNYESVICRWCARRGSGEFRSRPPRNEASGKTLQVLKFSVP